ncbi:dihydroneopterin aldolase [Hydrogenophaga pseudoflava]|uniref:dihydroneopterin aldolase n=1 Tax=Hydrogenophaga pseudoflava TaxID=47421 RepID=UPI0027E47B1D|nr:dihydroneopterin aldolase [Hydrogenophaga pseudoflava]MDQ7746648.1 dihydroneopterin aldolase [Hydrogenophaga pseudoflava]
MNATWTVRIERLATQLPVGIYEHERDAQPVWVSLTATGEAAAAPGALQECFDYEPLCRWLTQEWPASPHTPLLETRVNQVIGFLFATDPRVRHVWVGLYKQRVSQQALAVGMERACTRAEFEALQRQTAATQALIHTLTTHGEPHASLAQ